VLRNTLDRAGLAGVGVVAADGDWSVAKSMLADPQLNASVEAIG